MAHTEHGAPDGPPTAKPLFKFSTLIWCGVLLLFLIFIATCNSCGDDKKEKKAKENPSNRTSALPSRQPGSTKTLYEFRYNNNSLTFEVNGGRLFLYPKGGRIWVCPPSGRCYIDVPGVDQVRPAEVPGRWTITPYETSATGVEARIE